MILYLMQHGNAVEKEVDEDRPLSERGEKDVKAVAVFLKRTRIRVGAVWHSGKTRARQTAEFIAVAAAQGAKPQTSGGLNPKDPVGGLARELTRRSEDLAIVGHLPHLTKLAGLLLANDENSGVIQFQQGGILCLERREDGRWSVRWMVVPSLLES